MFRRRTLLCCSVSPLVSLEMKVAALEKRVLRYIQQAPTHKAKPLRQISTPMNSPTTQAAVNSDGRVRRNWLVPLFVVAGAFSGLSLVAYYFHRDALNKTTQCAPKAWTNDSLIALKQTAARAPSFLRSAVYHFAQTTILKANDIGEYAGKTVCYVGETVIREGQRISCSVTSATDEIVHAATVDGRLVGNTLSEFVHAAGNEMRLVGDTVSTTVRSAANDMPLVGARMSNLGLETFANARDMITDLLVRAHNAIEPLGNPRPMRDSQPHSATKRHNPTTSEPKRRQSATVPDMLYTGRSVFVDAVRRRSDATIQYYSKKASRSDTLNYAA